MIITRIAPSPTGIMHLGTARTALFAYLHAKKHNGLFKLRIEDTDKARNTPEAVKTILDGLAWLGLEHDGPIVYQSQNDIRHREIAHELVERGHAYLDYTTPEEMEALRAAWAAKSKAPFRYYDNPWRDTKCQDIDQPYVIRLKAPREGKTTICDMVQGEVKVSNHEIDDLILVRSDGTPTYMLAVVVDDHDAGVNYVIRGDDHLSNTFRQLPIYRAMGWDIPTYAHLPLILNEQGQKLSKRNGDAGIEHYRDRGIPPDAIFNYLLRLGWGSGDHEIISREQAIELFSLEDVGRAPARMDDKRLMHLSAHYMRDADIGSLTERLPETIRSNALAEILRERSRTFCEFDKYANMVAVAPKGITFESEIDNAILAELFIELQKLPTFTKEAIRTLVEAIADHNGLKLRKVVEPIRLAIFGEKISPPLFEVMPIMGHDECIKRLRN